MQNNSDPLSWSSSQENLDSFGDGGLFCFKGNIICSQSFRSLRFHFWGILGHFGAVCWTLEFFSREMTSKVSSFHAEVIFVFFCLVRCQNVFEVVD